MPPTNGGELGGCEDRVLGGQAPFFLGDPFVDLGAAPAGQRKAGAVGGDAGQGVGGALRGEEVVDVVTVQELLPELGDDVGDAAGRPVQGETDAVIGASPNTNPRGRAPGVVGEDVVDIDY